MTAPLVSILVPVCNDVEFLPQSLGSIARQTLDDFEVIVSDDCSADDSVQVTSEWAKKDGRFRVRRNSRNLGMTENWNAALGDARGRYVCKLDADDAMHRRFLEELVGDLEQGGHIHAAYCRTVNCNEDLEPIASYLGDTGFIRFGMDPLKPHVLPGAEWYRLCFSDVQLWHSNAQLYRREEFLALGGWDNTWGCASDTDLILRVLESGRNVSHNPLPGILYRQRPDSISHVYRKRGWLSLEGTLLHLLSLQRHSHRVKSVDLVLRKAWWRIWQNWKSIARDLDSVLLDLPNGRQEKIKAAIAQICEPPPRLIIEGWLRQRLWRLKRSR